MLLFILRGQGMVKILVVDDEEDICRILNKTFSRAGFACFSAHSGEEALRITKEERPFIVFLDIKMPTLSGLEVLGQIKAFDSNIKVVVLTFVLDKETQNKSKELGADHFIAKPAKPEALLDIVIKEVGNLIKKERN